MEYFVPYYAEDAGKLGANPSYKPFINVYVDAGDDVPVEESAPAMNSPEPADPTLQTAVVLPNSVASRVEDAISSLLYQLDDTLEKRLAVARWIRDHPTEAAHIKPGQVAQILEKVTFSLDQAAVAGDLAASMERANMLTCAHVAAAMRVCKYQATDIAKAMPFVNDPQNKQQVLDEIELKFERDSVENVFARSLL
jgi:hypothetical protein